MDTALAKIESYLRAQCFIGKCFSGFSRIFEFTKRSTGTPTILKILEDHRQTLTRTLSPVVW
jgi:hypothetical protein